MDTPSTLNLIGRVRNGDERAFSLLFASNRHRLTLLIHYRLGAELRKSIEVEDVLQETWLRALRQIDNFTHQGCGSFMRWLGTIAQHVIADQARHQGRKKREAGELIPLRSDSNPHGAEPANFETPTQVLAGKEGVDDLLRKLDALPAEYRQIIVLAKMECLTTSEIAQQLGRTKETTALLLHRALKRFRASIENGIPS